MSNYNYILTADWHLRADQPRCRVDDFWTVQKETCIFIFETCQQYNADLIIAGDLFDKGRPEKSQLLENLFLDLVNEYKISVYLVAGNHDLPYHRLEELENSSLGVILRHPNVNLLSDKVDIAGLSWTEKNENIKDPDTLVLHRFVAEKELPPWMNDGILADELMKQYPETYVFVTGDNHQSFTVEKLDKGIVRQQLINPGSITRQNASQIDFIPKIYLLDGLFELKKTRAIELPDQAKDAITLDYLEKSQLREERMDEFTKKLRGSVSLDFSFKKNLEENIKKAKLDDLAENKVWEAYK